jgi:hypothetical protein
MKIGVLTLTPKNNYGGILQAVALCGYLENRGHEIVLIDKKRFKRNIPNKIVTGLIERLPLQNIRNKRQDYLKTKQLEPFLGKYLPRKSKEIVSSQDLKALVEDEGFDAVIVGSDQVWRYQYIGDGHHNVFFLDFEVAKPVKKIAYAASFGKDKWEAPGHVPEISKLLEKFDGISTREKSGVELCMKIFSAQSVLNVLDPTMLVGPSFYDPFFNKLKKGPELKTITAYILDINKEKKGIVDFLKSSLEHSLGSLHQINLSEQKDGVFYSVEDWLWQIKNAEFIVTDSFHGMAFSILFEKQFIVIGNASRGLSRFTDLLSELGLCDRLISNEAVCLGLLGKRIDYSVVNEKLEALRGESERFLLDFV